MSDTETETNEDIVTCPRCNIEQFTSKPGYQGNVDYPALSRADNKTSVCSECGFTEAMRQARGRGVQQPSVWPLEHPWDVSS